MALVMDLPPETCVQVIRCFRFGDDNEEEVLAAQEALRRYRAFGEVACEDLVGDPSLKPRPVDEIDDDKEEGDDEVDSDEKMSDVEAAPINLDIEAHRLRSLWLQYQTLDKSLDVLDILDEPRDHVLNYRIKFDCAFRSATAPVPYHEFERTQPRTSIVTLAYGEYAGYVVGDIPLEWKVKNLFPIQLGVGYWVEEIVAGRKPVKVLGRNQQEKKYGAKDGCEKSNEAIIWAPRKHGLAKIDEDLEENQKRLRSLAIRYRQLEAEKEAAVSSGEEDMVANLWMKGKAKV